MREQHVQEDRGMGGGAGGGAGDGKRNAAAKFYASQFVLPDLPEVQAYRCVCVRANPRVLRKHNGSYPTTCVCVCVLEARREYSATAPVRARVLVGSTSIQW